MADSPTVLNIRALMPIVAFVLLAGCAAGLGPKRGAGGAASPSTRSEDDSSYDWHGQITMPFGVPLKSISVPLHEVLLFHDEAAGLATPALADAETKECYAVDGTPPRLAGQTPVAYLLCFDHDRLSRIESTVRLPAASAVQVFARACATWQAQASVVDDACEARSGTTSITAHLVNEPGALSTLSLVLLNANPVP